MTGVSARFGQLAAAGMLALSSLGAHADAALKLSFLEPTGTVGPNETIQVWIRITSVGDAAFTFDSTQSAESRFGLPDSIPLPLDAIVYTPPGPPVSVPFAIYQEAYLFTWRSCNDTFSTGCNPLSHAFQSPIGPKNWLDTAQLSLQPGEYLDIHHSDLVPVAGGAAAGTYTLTSLGVGLGVRGRSEADEPLEADLFSFGTCSTAEPGCGFTRTVVSAVPEPSTWAMMLGGLAVAGFVAGRRRRQG